MKCPKCQSEVPETSNFCLVCGEKLTTHAESKAAISASDAERKQAENNLIESERRYRGLFENMNAGCVLFEVVQDDNDVPVDLIIIAANKGFEVTTGLKIHDVTGKRLTRVLPDIENDAADWIGTYGKVALTGEFRQFEQGSAVLDHYYSIIAYQAGPKQCAVTFVDISERKQTANILRTSNRLLKIFAGKDDMVSMLRESVSELKNFTGCAAVGIRLLDEDGNIPYKAYDGFSRAFYELESPISIKLDKCMCINVIKGAFDSKLPFYTEGRSFYMNGTTNFLAAVSQEEKGETRNMCNEAGYESVALVPIRLDEQHIIGLFHVADPRKNMVPLDMVEALESFGKQLGSAICVFR